ncbi:MAG: family 20 glycosylhydrolase [bacterium]|nr:family 20 glycosylhydrolase [bacterium]
MLSPSARGPLAASYTPGAMGARRSRKSPSRGCAAVPLLPKPKQLSRRRGEFQLGPETAILLPPSKGPLDQRLLLAARTAQAELRAKTGCDLGVDRPHSQTGKKHTIRCVLDRSAAIAPRLATARDAYRLTVRANEIEIAAPSIDGLRYGLQTLCQLVSARGRIAAVRILDQPDFRDRGIMLDVSRGKVPSRHTVEELIDLCSRLRLNVLMLYVEHTFDFRAHPEVGAGASPLDAQTILAIDTYAAERGVELIPCLQSLGHMEHVLSLDRYAKLAESDRLWSLSPSRSETYDFLGDLYDEFLPLFRSARFNANCDEPFDLGRGQSAERFPRKSPGRLFADHVSRLRRLAGRHEKKLMIWADFALGHPDQIDRIERDVVLMDWWYEANFDFDRIQKLRRSGFEVWACPGTSSWNSLFPRVANSCENITGWADAGRRHGATGLLNTDWGDFGHYNAIGVSLHSYAWGAQQAWSGELDANAFDRAFARHVFGEKSARLGRLYRRLGAIHATGFNVVNGSALQYLYFDALDRSFFLQHGGRRALESSARKLDVVRREVERLTLAEAGDDFTGLARREIAWATEATDLSIEKGLAAIEYNAWREDPTRLKTRARKGLARRLEALADRQREQFDSLRALWLARNSISEFHKTSRRIKRSISSLRRGARRLQENRPPRPPQKSELTMLEIFNEIRSEFGMARR